MGLNLWDRVIHKAKDIDAWRKVHLAIAESMDAWRIVPRGLAIGYAYLTYEVVKWYMSLEPFLMEGCTPITSAAECIIQNPTTTHGFLVTAVIGGAAAVFGLYTTSGKTWSTFTPWNPENLEERQRALAPTIPGGRRADDPRLPEKVKECRGE